MNYLVCSQRKRCAPLETPKGKGKDLWLSFLVPFGSESLRSPHNYPSSLKSFSMLEREREREGRGRADKVPTPCTLKSASNYYMYPLLIFVTSPKMTVHSKKRVYFYPFCRIKLVWRPPAESSLRVDFSRGPRQRIASAVTYHHHRFLLRINTVFPF